ncbi:PilT protein domain protein [uncultured delta proteobacterium]|uniref:PilT protein domain protein n=1 Tax=uncultured delta proteobacterium TaxID=34034 RepID=A0A212IXM3_9DELT|nr:PilT protein domain protein [uncultured delta proteobacterium]
MKPLRVVLDTNCLISALLFKNGKLTALRHAWHRGAITPIVCKETVAELIRVLAYPKFRLSKEDIDTLLAEILPFSETRNVKCPTTPVSGLSDPDDVVFVHLAKQSKADMLISGDAHLLLLNSANMRILAPADFMPLIQE